MTEVACGWIGWTQRELYETDLAVVEAACRGADEHLRWLSPYDLKPGEQQGEQLQKATPRAIVAAFRRLAHQHERKAARDAGTESAMKKAIGKAQARRAELEREKNGRSSS